MFPAKPTFTSPAERSAWFVVRNDHALTGWPPEAAQTLCETTGLAAIVGIQSNLIRRLGGRTYPDFRNQNFDSRVLRVNGRFDDATLKALWIAARWRMLDVPPPPRLDGNAIMYRLAIACAQHNVTPLVLQAALWLAYGADGASVPVGAGDITTIEFPAGTSLPIFGQTPPVPNTRGVSMHCRPAFIENETGSGLPRIVSPAGALRPAGAVGASGWTEFAKGALRKAIGRPAASVPWNTVLPGQVPPPRPPLQWGLGAAGLPDNSITGPLGAPGQIGPAGCG